MHTIEQYSHAGSGYEPLLIRSGWQFAQLNYADDLALARIGRLERHKHTDEVFLLHRGSALLIAAEECGAGMEICDLQHGRTYNVPAGLWHAIALEPESIVFVVENANTHLNDVEYSPLSAEQIDILHAQKENEQ